MPKSISPRGMVGLPRGDRYDEPERPYMGQTLSNREGWVLVILFVSAMVIYIVLGELGIL